MIPNYLDLRNCDNMKLMAQYPDKHFDLAIVDPPYGIDIANRTGSIGQKKGQGRITKYKRKEWDNAVPDRAYFKELFRVSKNQIIWGGNYFTDCLPPSMCWIVYDKLQPEGVTFAMAELAFTSFKKSTKTFKTSRSNMQNCVSNNESVAIGSAKIHPAQKPHQLYQWLLKNFAKPGDKILDTHLGSMSIAIAVHEMNKQGMNLTLVGCELDEDYYREAMRRVELHCKQQSLF